MNESRLLREREPMPFSIKARCTYCSEWRAPWKPDGVRRNVAVTRWPVWVRSLVGKRGVYLIRDAATKAMIYIGRAKRCLKDALVRHFFQWGPDPRGIHRRAVFDRGEVEVKVYFIRSEWVAATEADLIALHRPRENRREEASNRTRGEYQEEVPF